MCALSKDPAGRYATANELLAALSTVRAKMPRTTTVTKTLHMGQNLRVSQPDAFADTTDMHRFSDVDASRVRPRIVVQGRQAAMTAPERRPRSHVPLFVGALVAAIVMGGIGGFVATRAHPPAPSPVVSATAPPPSAAPLPSAVTAPSAVTTPTATTTSSATAATASSASTPRPASRPPRRRAR